MFSGNLAITFFAGLSLDELMVRLARLQSRSALLYLTMFEEPDGTTHKASEIAGRLALAAPVYSVYSTYHDRGIVGGYLATFEAVVEIRGAPCRGQESRYV